MATKNRQDILEISIPLMLSQSCRPVRMIVVDSSDDHGKTIEGLNRAFGAVTVSRGDRTALTIVRSSPGLTKQRMEGLKHVTSEIVFFPDDDALWYPGMAQAIMRIYERDSHGGIGGVCAAEAIQSPPGIASGLRRVYRMSVRDRIQQQIAHGRTRFEKKCVPDPFVILGRSRWDVNRIPEWLDEENAVLVEWMTGFRMTFRTERIRQCGFETAFSEYGGFEDVDACFGVSKKHLLIGARNAQVFHYRAPGVRADGLGMGMRQILNKAYVVCKHSDATSIARVRLRPWGIYKLALYVGGMHSRYGRTRLRGACRAWRKIPQLLDADSDKLREVYLRCRAECLGEAGGDEQAGRAR